MDGRAPERSGWVLVGGKSQRMGRDKALLPHAPGEPLAVHVARTLSTVCGTVTLIGNQALYSGLGFAVVPDNFPGIGPLAGIDAALQVTKTGLNLIAACDMPALDPRILADLFEAAADCALPQYEDGRVEPLCAVYHRRCAPLIRRAIESGVRKVTEALRSLDVRYVQVSHTAPFANLNTPEDLDRYRNG